MDLMNLLSKSKLIGMTDITWGRFFKVGFLGKFGFLLSSQLNSVWLKKIQFFEMVILRPCLVILSPTIFFNQTEFRTSVDLFFMYFFSKDQNKFLVCPNKTLNNNTWVLKNSKRNGSPIRLIVNEHKQENAYFWHSVLFKADSVNFK